MEEGKRNLYFGSVFKIENKKQFKKNKKSGVFNKMFKKIIF